MKKAFLLLTILFLLLVSFAACDFPFTPPVETDTPDETDSETDSSVPEDTRPASEGLEFVSNGDERAIFRSSEPVRIPIS